VHNYTVSDILGALEGVVLLSVFLLIPGYVVGWLLNLFTFRERQLTERILLSVPLSICFSSITAVLVTRFTSLSVAVLFFVALGVVFLGCIVYELRTHPERLKIHFDRETRILAIAMAVWTVVALIVLLDLQIGHKIYFSVTAWDHCVRSALTRSALETGVPPNNPFFFPGHIVQLRYYYYWNLLCALPAKLGHIDPRLTMYASCVWAGYALAAIVPLYLKHFIGDRIQLRRKSLLGIALLVVTGLDLLPTIVNLVGPGHIVQPDMEWWDYNQITAWTDATLWVPNHIAALVACLLGFLTIWNVSPQAKTGERLKASAIGALAFASSAGLSLYVTFAFGAFLIVWNLLLLHKEQWTELLLFAMAGAGAALLSILYLKDILMAPGAGDFATWAVRWPMGPLLHIESVLLGLTASIAALPLWYFIELGFFFVVGVLRLRSTWHRRERLSRTELASWLLLGTSLFIASFLRSSVIAANDLGMRSALFMQFILLLWAVPLVHEWWSNTDREKFRVMLAPVIRPATLRWLVVLGVLATIYQVALLRTYAFVHADQPGHEQDARVVSKDKTGTVYGIRQAYESMEKIVPAHAIVQYNPLPHNYLAYLLYASRRPASAGPGCGTSFGGKIYDCIQIQFKLTYVFNNPHWEGAQSLDAVCDKYSINALMVTDQDPVWQRPDTWVWKRSPLIANEFVRVFGCGSRNRGWDSRH